MQEDKAFLDRLRKDYLEVRDIALKIFESDIDTFCCHEMAYLISRGLKNRGYEAFVEDGYSEMICKQHSWVLVKNDGGFWRGNKDIIIDFYFHQFSCFFAKPIWYDGIIIDSKEKSYFKRKRIDYQLAKGIEVIAEQLFPEVK